MLILQSSGRGALSPNRKKLFSDSTKRWGNGLIYTRTEIWYFPFKVSSHKIKIRNMTKVVKSIIGLILAMFAVVVLDSCNKQENEEAEFTASEQQTLGDFQAVMPTARASSTVYYSTPSVGGYTPNSSSNNPIDGFCGTAEGGVIRAEVARQTTVGGTNKGFIILITKQDGSTFKGSGTAYIKSGSPCGSIISKRSYRGGTRNEIAIPLIADFEIGYAYYYPVVINEQTGTRYYAEPILVYTDPIFKAGPYKQGDNIGTANGVIVQAAGPKLGGSAKSVQCTEFCSRYYSQVYRKNIVNTGQNGGNADTWFDKAKDKGLVAFTNGTTKPQIGDIVCFENDPVSDTLNGHVAIIMEVGWNYIKIAHQNSRSTKGWLQPIGGRLDYDSSTKIISSPANFTVQGVLRNP